ncbi:MAG: M48 family metalloprotease [Rhodococcus sp.]|nr:M48 family metalloprotease [Rhodococcus sp. (in: high G+C Gram-positive bacteria)]MBJ7325040.1 M48 family metalloprotease [Rhodococcus sp. (in: high G+C Gram-positive bacteria)]
MTDTKPAEITLSPQQRQAWVDMVAEVSAELGMAIPPAVEFDCTSELKGAMRYDHDRDTVTIFGGWVEAASDPQALASKALASHELGHRLDRERLLKRGAALRAAYCILGIALAVALVIGAVEAFQSSGRFGQVIPIWVLLLPFVFALLRALLIAVVRWPDEYRADAVAASLYGPQGVHAFLDVIGARTESRLASWLSPSHPTDRMRRARHPQ